MTDHALHDSQQELEAKNQEIAILEGQKANLQGINTTLIGYTQFLKDQIAFMEATLGGNTDDSQSTTNTPDDDDQEMEEDPEEPEMEEDPEEPIFIEDE